MVISVFFIMNKTEITFFRDMHWRLRHVEWQVPGTVTTIRTRVAEKFRRIGRRSKQKLDLVAGEMFEKYWCIKNAENVLWLGKFQSICIHSIYKNTSILQVRLYRSSGNRQIPPTYRRFFSLLSGTDFLANTGIFWSSVKYIVNPSWLVEFADK